MKKLNLGCGNDIREGWVNLDIARLPGVDVVHDMSILPLPFADEEFDQIACIDILEHLDYIPLLKDLHRIMKKDGIIEIRVPHFTSRYNFIDPTHRKFFSFQTFDFFVLGSMHDRDYYFDFHFSEIVSSRIVFDRSGFLHNRIIEPWVNRNTKSKWYYELTGWSRIFPAANIVVEIKK